MTSRTRFLALALVAGVTLLACQKGDGAGEKGQPDPFASKTTSESLSKAAAKATPGSHEDWCDEHQVPESLCTRCNPALVAAFKATGDWCDEHGLPESQCLTCNPNLKIERPPKVAKEG